MPSIGKWAMVPSHITERLYHLLSIFSFRVLWLPKKARLSHILGKVEEREPEGEVLSEERTGNTILYFTKGQLILLFFLIQVPFFPFFSLYHHFSSRWIRRGGGSADTHQRRGRSGSDAKLGGGGGLPSPTRGRSQGATGRAKFVPLSPILPSSLYFSIDTEFSFTILTFYLNFLFFSLFRA